MVLWRSRYMLHTRGDTCLSDFHFASRNSGKLSSFGFIPVSARTLLPAEAWLVFFSVFVTRKTRLTVRESSEFRFQVSPCHMVPIIDQTLIRDHMARNRVRTVKMTVRNLESPWNSLFSVPLRYIYIYFFVVDRRDVDFIENMDSLWLFAK